MVMDYKINYQYLANLHSKDLYIPIGKINNNDQFFPFLNDGSEFKSFICCFYGNTVLKVKSNASSYSLVENNKIVSEVEKSLPIKSKKGTFKTISSMTKENFKKGCDELIEKIDNAIKTSEEDLEKQRDKIDFPFINEDDRDIILESYEDYISNFKSKKLEVEKKNIRLNNAKRPINYDKYKR